jgi:hypothetical protein
MSQENVRVGPPGADASLPDQAPLTRAEAEIRQWVADAWDEDGDYYPVRKFPESRPCHGRDEIADFLIDYGKVWARYEQHTVRLIPIGDDRVLLHARLWAEGRESGLSLDGDLYYAVWLRHGRCFRQEDHLTLSGALHALGFRGDTLHAVGLPE